MKRQVAPTGRGGLDGGDRYDAREGYITMTAALHRAWYCWAYMTA